ncbi:MAG TPA: hypothetical protein VGG56_08750 [Terracidiphilus sp.]|jgi:hypothetical protein
MPSTTRVGAVSGGYIERRASLDRQEPADSPSTELVLPPLSAIQKQLVLAKWQLVDTRYLEDVRINEIRPGQRSQVDIAVPKEMMVFAPEIVHGQNPRSTESPLHGQVVLL